MSLTLEQLPAKDVVEPTGIAELEAVVREAAATGTPLYPVGGGTSLDYGLPARAAGRAVSLRGLQQVIDYPARDMTITVQAGITCQALGALLAEQGQQLPLDVPRAERATLGGVLATNFSGHRRYGYGTARDYVIGIRAVDGRGDSFAGGGRVVKNVAGYDFCKLLIGSLGTLGIITEVTLKLKPVTERQVWMACTPRDLAEADALLAAMVHSATAPAAIEVLMGSHWQDVAPLAERATASDGCWLLAGLEGTAAEVDWMITQLTREWQEQGIAPRGVWTADEAEPLRRALVEFPALPDCPLVLKANVVPSHTIRLLQAARELDPECSVQAHAGNGVVLVRCRSFPAAGLSRALVGGLQPAAAAGQGNVIVLANPGGQEMTHQSVWGGLETPYWLMSRIKQQFDPHSILNPDRFVYS